MPRVAPITGKSDVPAEYHDVVDGVLQVFGQVRGPFSMLLHSPKLAERMLNLGNFFRSNDSVVAAKDRSLAILVAAREREGAYVWAAQVAAARRAGVREEAIDLIRAKGNPAKLPAEERDIVAYAQQLVQKNRIDQATFDALKPPRRAVAGRADGGHQLLWIPVRRRQRVRSAGPAGRRQTPIVASEGALCRTWCRAPVYPKHHNRPIR